MGERQEYIGRGWWDDQRVQDALKERECSGVMLFDCPYCDSQNYYNEGSTAYCSACDRSFAAKCEGENEDLYDEGHLEECYTVEDAIDAEVQTEDLP